MKCRKPLNLDDASRKKGAAKLRIWIDLPDAPSALFEQARHGDDDAAVLARRRALFSYFGASVETKEEAEKLVFALAATLFPAFRQRSEEARKRPGRRPAFRPKYQVFKSHSETRIYQIFLKTNPALANELQVQGKPLQLGSFKKLLTVGRSSRKYMVLWYRDLLSVFPIHLKTRREYITIYHDIAFCYDSLYWPGFVSPLWLDPHLVRAETLPETGHQDFEKPH
jgi:hypothetical protein